MPVWHTFQTVPSNVSQTHENSESFSMLLKLLLRKRCGIHFYKNEMAMEKPKKKKKKTKKKNLVKVRIFRNKTKYNRNRHVIWMELPIIIDIIMFCDKSRKKEKEKKKTKNHTLCEHHLVQWANRNTNWSIYVRRERCERGEMKKKKTHEVKSSDFSISKSSNHNV